MPEELAGEVTPQETLPLDTPKADSETKAAPADPDTEAESDDEKKTQVDERKFTQAELDAIVQREKAKTEAKTERRALKAFRETLERVVPRPAAPAEQQTDGKPSRSHYANEDDFLEALTDWKLDQRDAKSRQEAHRFERQSQLERTESLYAKAEKLPGFDREAFEELPLTKTLAEAIVESDMPDRVMAFLTQNPEEVDRIIGLPPARQAAEMGKLEAKLASAPKTSNAPPPIKPIGAGGRGTNNDPEHQSQAEYEAMRKKQGAHWAK